MKQPACSASMTRRRFIQWASGGAISGVVGLTFGPFAAASNAVSKTVRDRLWAGAHDAGVYNGDWGLPGNSRVTPVEGAHYLGVANIIMILYEGKPAPPFEQYAIPFKSLKRVNWSITGASGATSDEERKSALQLASTMPNLTGVFMDDFFHIDENAGKPHWLAEKNAAFPVSLTLTLPVPVSPTELELAQSEFSTGYYRSKDFTVDLSANGSEWQEVAQGRLPNTPGASHLVRLPGTSIQALRVRILSTHDTQGAMSCGLRRLRLRAGADEIPLHEANVRASSTYPSYDAQNILFEKKPLSGEAPAALSVEQLRRVRKQLENVNGRRLDLAVTLYTYQLEPRIRSHLGLCDVISLWTWNFDGLKALEANFEKLKALAPSKRILLGCYMWVLAAANRFRSS